MYSRVGVGVDAKQRVNHHIPLPQRHSFVSTAGAAIAALAESSWYSPCVWRDSNQCEFPKLRLLRSPYPMHIHAELLCDSDACTIVRFATHANVRLTIPNSNSGTWLKHRNLQNSKVDHQDACPYTGGAGGRSSHPDPRRHRRMPDLVVAGLFEATCSPR